MPVQISNSNNQLTCLFDKHMDSIMSQKAENELSSHIDDAEMIIFDLQNTTYISSVFLRLVIMIAKKKGKDNFKIINARSENIQSVFRISGFSNILNISS